jgi:hypothetical protein
MTSAKEVLSAKAPKKIGVQAEYAVPTPNS